MIRSTADHVPSEKELCWKNVVKRTIEVMRPLYVYSSITCSILVPDIVNTYKLPVKNVMVNPIFRRVVVCRFHTTRTGKINMTISVIMFGKLPYLKKASLFMQWEPGISGFQLAAKGVHATKAVTMVAIVRPIRVPIRV